MSTLSAQTQFVRAHWLLGKADMENHGAVLEVVSWHFEGADQTRNTAQAMGILVTLARTNART